MKNIVFVFGWFAALLFLAASCNHKELCYDHHHTRVRVEFDWSEAADAAPAGMSVLFYPVGGGVPQVREFEGREGGEIEIPDGDYDVVCYNADAANVTCRGMESLDLLEASTRAGSVMEGLDGTLAAPPHSESDEAVVAAPGRLWSCRRNGVRIVPSSEAEDNVVLLAPRRVTRHVVWEVSQVVNAGGLTAVRAVLSGVSGSLRLGSFMPVTGAVSMPSSGGVDGGNAEKLTGGFDCFGCGKDVSCKHILTLYCWSPYGNVTASWDVTDQVHAAADGEDIRLVVSGRIVIPDGQSGGFTPGVDGWEDKSSDIIM